jgi:hypothetical protein
MGRDRTPDGVVPSPFGVVHWEFHLPQRENGVIVVGHLEHVVAEDDVVFGVGVRVFLSLEFQRLLVGRGVEVGVSSVNSRLERLLLTGEQIGSPVGQ